MDISHQAADEAYVANKQSLLIPSLSRTPVLQNPMKLENPVKIIIDKVNANSLKSPVIKKSGNRENNLNGISRFSELHKVFDKPRGKIRNVFTQRNFLKNIDYMQKNAEQAKRELAEKEMVRKLDFQSVLNYAEENVRTQRKSGDVPSKRKLAELPSCNLKSFKIPKKTSSISSTTTNPIKKHSIEKQKAISEMAESAMSAHIEVS